MKKINGMIAGMVIAIFIFSLLPAALADNDDNSKSRKKAGTTPDSFLYGLDVALDNIRYALSVNTDAKARVGLETAEERLMEVREMLLQNKIEAAKRAEHEHKKAFVKVKASVDSMSKKQNKETVKKLDEIKKEIEEYEDEIEQTHANINIEIKSKGNLTSEQKAVIEAVLKSLQNQTADVKIKINMHRDEIKIKIREDIDKDDDDETGSVEVEVKGNVTLSQEAKAALDTFVANLSGSSEVEIELEIVKKNNTTIIKKEKIEGRLTTAQMSLWNGFKNKAIASVNSAEGNTNLKIEIEIEHKERDREDDDEKEHEEREGIIKGIVFVDSNRDGIENNNESNSKINGLPVWTIFLDFNNNGIFDGRDLKTNTHSNGSYKFNGLEEGRQTVKLEIMSGWMTTTLNPVRVSLDDEEDAIVNFGVIHN